MQEPLPCFKEVSWNVERVRLAAINLQCVVKTKIDNYYLVVRESPFDRYVSFTWVHRFLFPQFSGCLQTPKSVWNDWSYILKAQLDFSGDSGRLTQREGLNVSAPHRGTYTRSDMRRGIRKETEAKTSSVFSTCNSPSCAGPHPLVESTSLQLKKHFECGEILFTWSFPANVKDSKNTTNRNTQTITHRSQLFLVTDVSKKLVLNALISRHLDLVGGLNPSEKYYIVKLDHFPQFSGWK